MSDRTRWLIVGIVSGVALAAACQSAPEVEGDETTATTSSPGEAETGQQEPVAAPRGAQTTLRSIDTDTEAVEITPLHHGSLFLSWGERTIYIDPTTDALEAGINNGIEPLPEADLVLVTHTHPDHLDPEAISRIRGQEAAVIVPQSVADQADGAIDDLTVIANGEQTTAFGDELEIEAFPMYNLERKRDDGQFYHPKGQGNAYILTVDGARIYLSGDTECTPEMKALEDIDAAFLSMNLPYTMLPEEAAECVRDFKPDVLIPYHFRGQDPSNLHELLEDVPEVEVRLLEWYSDAEVSP